jgi:hypothetical protein
MQHKYQLISLCLNIMSGEEKTNFYELTGEIIEIYEKDKSRIAKIKFDPGLIDICIDKIKDAHLNDKLIICSSIQIKSIIEIFKIL